MKILLGLLFLPIIVFAQDAIPTNYFNNPLDIPLILSGSFGELRSNHFHSGLDIKTQQKVGIPIYAPADGYVSRIKVAHYGYGKALYIKHPNGYSTVYAHLQKYAGDIQDFVKKTQYKKELYTVEMFPDATELPIKKGELIGYTGNSGSSGGPHLHFEIRDAHSRPMNPLLFGIDIPDTKAPILTDVFAYPIDENSQVNASQKPVKLRVIKQQDGSFKAENVSAYGTIGFGVATVDQFNGATNKNGVYAIKSKFNGNPVFSVQFDKFSFSETRYINRYIDYAHFKNKKTRIQKLYRESNNPLSIITKDENNGLIVIDTGFTSNYSIKILDFKGNETQINIPIYGKKDSIQTITQIDTISDYINSNQSTSITKGKFSIFFPTESLYESQHLKISSHSDTLKLHNDRVPLHKNVTITATIDKIKTDDLNSLYIGKLNYKNKPQYVNTSQKENKLVAKTKTLGTFVISQDTTKPTIVPINFAHKKWISKNKYLALRIKDSGSGIKSYRATINGKFILMEYNYKNNVLIYNFEDNIIQDSENNLKVIVVDNVGNSATFEATFFRKQT